MLEARVKRWGRSVTSIIPLFPSYLFARFCLRAAYFDVRYTGGVSGLVSAGNEPVTVPLGIIEGIRSRECDGRVTLAEKPFERGEKLSVVEGPFRGFAAVFERYLSGSERVSILLSAVGTDGPRIILPLGSVARER
jgi:transcriptional antiterminator RfaH